MDLGGLRTRGALNILSVCAVVVGLLTPGTILRREWQGQVYEVAVTTAGFEHDGRLFRSLSAAASAITGVKWNGLRFFGLKEA